VASKIKFESVKHGEIMYNVYLLESVESGRWYIGYTPSPIKERLIKHNSGIVISTRPFMPWKLIYSESYLNRKDATGREKFLKSGTGRKYLKKQLSNYLALDLINNI